MRYRDIFESVEPVVLRHRGASARVHDDGEDGLYLTGLRSSDPGKGHAHEVMRQATRHADNLGKKMSLTAIPDRDEDFDRLTSFYREHGFRHVSPNSAHMIREPKT